MLKYACICSVKCGVEYKDVWSAPINGAELPCERDPRTGYALTVAMIEQSPSGQPTLTNVPQLISAIYSIFIQHHGEYFFIVYLQFYGINLGG